jgi:hypothetical protein
MSCLSKLSKQRRRVLALGCCLPLLAAAADGPAQNTLHFCRAPDWSGHPRAVVAWQQGTEVVVQAARAHDALPAYLFADRNPPQPWPQQLRLPVSDGRGLHRADGQVWLRVSATLSLVCEVTHED